MTAHDCATAGCTDLVRRAHEERIAQGLEIGITDADALRTTAAIFNNPADVSIAAAKAAG